MLSLAGGKWTVSGVGCAVLVCWAAAAPAQVNRVANPDFEQRVKSGFFADWERGAAGKIDKVLFAEAEAPHAGKACLRMVGTPKTWTTCPAKSITVKPETDYWVTWWFKAKQPATSRTYLFLQTNLAQRVFPNTDRNGDFDWAFNIVHYRTKPGETTLSPVLTMQTGFDPPGTSWWDEIGVWDKLPPELEARYREEHPWDDVTQSTAQWLTQTDACTIWGDRAESRIYPHTAAPAQGAPGTISLTAPGGGHDVYQLVVVPRADTGPVSLQFSSPSGPGDMPEGSLSYRVARCVPVQEVRDKSFPVGPTPDPLVAPDQPEAVRPGENAVFWIDWAPPRGGKAGTYATTVRILAGGKPIADVPLRLRRWGFDLPETPHYRTMVMVSPWFIRRFYPGISEEDAYRLAWDLLSNYRLSGFNITLWPTATLKDGKLQLDWARFDRLLAAAKQYRASAITVGPMFGGGAGQGWKPHKFVGLTPLADRPFDSLYAEMNRQVAERLRQAGMLDKAYVYPYDEPEPDYMDQIARLCDLVHQGDPALKCLMTVDPQISQPLWGKVKAWIIPSSTLKPAIVEARRAAGDEIWLYNMTADIESTPLEHRLYMWQGFQTGAQGGLLWNCCWWNKINPWENPTAVAVPVGRNSEGLYRYQAGQASLFYPDPAGKGPLVPSLRVVLIRQGVEDVDILHELVAARRELLPRLSAKAKQDDLMGKARRALAAPVVFDSASLTTSHARTEAVRQLAGNELEVARQAPAVIAYPTRIGAKLAVAGFVEPGAQLTLNGRPVVIDGDGRFETGVTEQELAAGVSWKAKKGDDRKSWQWPGLR
jgi:hypothetical protein